jgi:hypothetical protein
VLRSGATGLNAAVQSNIVTLSWRYLPTVLASSLIMLAWALIINNLGRRRYPIYWWAAGKTFVSATKAADEKERRNELREVEAGLRSTEGHVFDPSNGENGSNGQKGSGHGERAGNTSAKFARSHHGISCTFLLLQSACRLNLSGERLNGFITSFPNLVLGQ